MPPPSASASVRVQPGNAAEETGEALGLEVGQELHRVVELLARDVMSPSSSGFECAGDHVGEFVREAAGAKARNGRSASDRSFIGPPFVRGCAGSLLHHPIMAIQSIGVTRREYRGPRVNL